MRYEYGITHLVEFENLNSMTYYGEVGISKSLWTAIGFSDPLKSMVNPLRERHTDNFVVYEADALLAVVQSIERLLDVYEDFSSLSYFPLSDEINPEEVGHFCHLFISHGVFWKLNKDDFALHLGSSASVGNSEMTLDQNLTAWCFRLIG
ncbi:hypothetical protein HDU67_003151 [Dinochytrium kinnereticum]|nr:hypothetical protein HDU67_003151 [Dinochytrium kinnereticum]